MLLGYLSANIQKEHRIHPSKQTMSGNTTRRNFLITSVAVAGSVVGAFALQQQAADTAAPPATMLERVLGRTGVNVARAFQPLSNKVLAAIEQRTAAVWEDGTFFRAWT
jgi:hypothetical protein